MIACRYICMGLNSVCWAIYVNVRVEQKAFWRHAGRNEYGDERRVNGGIGRSDGLSVGWFQVHYLKEWPWLIAEGE